MEVCTAVVFRSSIVCLWCTALNVEQNHWRLLHEGIFVTTLQNFALTVTYQNRDQYVDIVILGKQRNSFIKKSIFSLPYASKPLGRFS